MKKPGPDEALERLKQGNKRFYTGASSHPHSNADRLYLAATTSQRDYAFATVIGCSDSRVPPELIFDVGVMDLFVIRTAGNVCGPTGIASVEFGLAHVETPLLVVLGHDSCGAVTAATHAVQGRAEPFESNIPPLLDTIAPAVKRAMAQHPELHGNSVIPYAIEENIWEGIDTIFRQSPTARDLVKAGKVRVAAAMYELSVGYVHWLDPAGPDAILSRVESGLGKKDS